MIVERLTFQAKYGKGDALLGIFREYRESFGNKMPGTAGRAYTDSTGRMFTLVFDTEYRDYHELADGEAASREVYASAEFGEWFARMEPLVEHGERQILNVVED